jgi:magnesium chelatase subunit H
MPKATSPADPIPLRVVIITLDNHLASVVQRAEARLRHDLPGLHLAHHAASDWADDPTTLERCLEDIGQGDIVIATMLFMEDHIQAVLPALAARCGHCDAMIGAISAGDIIKLTRLGGLNMSAGQKGPIALLKKLRGSKSGSSGAGQMKMLKRLPQILRFIPGGAQDLRAYFLTMQYWLSGSEDNVCEMVRFLASRYANAGRRPLRASLVAAPPREYPETGLYHPRSPDHIVERIESLPGGAKHGAPRVGLIVLRSYVLADDAGHYDGVIEALEARGITAIPAFASGLDARPAIEKYFLQDGKPTIDALVSLTGFSLVGGPAYSDQAAAEKILAQLDVPYIAALPLEFQSLERWTASATGLSALESTLMVAIPELDGATGPIVFGGRSECKSGSRGRMQAHPERANRLAGRVQELIALRNIKRRDRRVGIVIFNVPPNAGAVGSAAYLSVFASLWNTLKHLKAEGYTVDLPDDVEALRGAILGQEADRRGGDANVHALIPVDDHVRREPHLAQIEAQWGPAPGRQLADGQNLFVMGARFGNVFIGVQPAFGVEGDPMRLMFEGAYAPTHAFSAFYRWLREDFGAQALVHFGTHGALEFMPGKQVGLDGADWPDRLIGDTPHFYVYACNNPTEGLIARRRSAATLITYMTPPLGQAGLHKELQDLKALIQRERTAAAEDRLSLRAVIHDITKSLDLPSLDDDADGTTDDTALAARIAEIEEALIPTNLHVFGEPPTVAERVELMAAMAQAREIDVPLAAIEFAIGGLSAERALARAGASGECAAALKDLMRFDALVSQDHELPALVHALDGGFVRPAPGGDLVRTPEVAPTGRNMHGFDPFRLPSAVAVHIGARQADRLLSRHARETGALPESIAMVLWGSDNLKNEGEPIAQAMALMGARPRFDAYGRLCGASLIPLPEMGRPRIDVVLTLSGIFRDLLALQTRMLADAAYLCAAADEPEELNFLRKHALALQAEQGCDLETAALRVFSNADGVYGSNVNALIDTGVWSEEEELADAFENRKCFAYGRNGPPIRQSKLMRGILKSVDFTYQNLESIELGVTTIDQYVDTLGGVSRAVERARGEAKPVYVVDATHGDAKVRTLSEQVAHETHARTLNPRWYEGLLQHGFEGVRQIEAQVTNTLGWSATTGKVAPWVYQRITETYVLDPAMRRRLAELNPKASARMANRLLEAHARAYWRPDAATLEALRNATDELEDHLEGLPAA